MQLAHTLGVERAAIFHVDDVGMCHGANRGFLDLAGRGLVTCGSVMVPCPWFREIAEAAADFNAEFGQKRFANQRLIRVLGDRDAIESGQAMPFLGLKSTTEGRQAGYQCRAVATVAREAGLKALFKHESQSFSQRIDHADGSSMMIRALAFGPIIRD